MPSLQSDSFTGALEKLYRGKSFFVETVCINKAVCEEFLDNICAAIKSEGTNVELVLAYQDDLWFNALTMASGLCCFFFFLLIYNMKELQVHPMKLVMYTSLTEGILLTTRNNNFFICTVQSYKLFAWTVFFNGDAMNQARAVIFQILTCVWITYFA